MKLGFWFDLRLHLIAHHLTPLHLIANLVKSLK